MTLIACCHAVGMCYISHIGSIIVGVDLHYIHTFVLRIIISSFSHNCHPLYCMQYDLTPSKTTSLFCGIFLLWRISVVRCKTVIGLQVRILVVLEFAWALKQLISIPSTYNLYLYAGL